MAFTRFYDDPDRIKKQLQQSTDQGMYMLNQPGPGDRLPIILDPAITLQKWGANRHVDPIGVENELMGLTAPLSRDATRTPFTSTALSYPIHKTEATVHSRTIAPAWMVREMEQNRRHVLLLDPQAHVEIPFNNNISTRILESNRAI